MTNYDYNQIAKIYLKVMLSLQEGVFTDRYFNTEIERKVNKAILNESNRLIKFLNKSIKYNSNGMTLDDIIDNYLNMKERKNNE